MGSTTRTPGTRVAPIGESRKQILDWLASNGGEITDPSGKATPKLRIAVGYAGAVGGFGALLSSMDRSGEIVRVLNGRRCTRIALPGKARSAKAPTAAPAAPATPTTAHTNGNGNAPASSDAQYGELATALLNQVLDILSAPRGDRDDTALVAAREEIAALRGQIAEKDKLVDKLQGEITRMTAERNTVLDRFRNVRSRQSTDMAAISRVARS